MEYPYNVIQRCEYFRYCNELNVVTWIACGRQLKAPFSRNRSSICSSWRYFFYTQRRRKSDGSLLASSILVAEFGDVWVSCCGKGSRNVWRSLFEVDSHIPRYSVVLVQVSSVVYLLLRYSFSSRTSSFQFRMHCDYWPNPKSRSVLT